MRPTPIDSESPFDVRELFFSITDLHGVIETGNDVFTRVSKYSQKELFGSPHNIIRHPDMPKGVFQLLWQYIQSGRRIAAYVKNMAKDGSYYWVLATVFPIEGGYLSIRLKPTSGLLPKVADLYAEMLKVEKKQGVAASLEVLSETLGTLGFANYDAFMIAALFAELKSREALIAAPGSAGQAEGLGATAGTDSERLSEIAGHCSTLGEHFSQLFAKLDFFASVKDKFQTKAKSIRALAKETGLHSLNAITEAARLQHAGKVLSVVAQQMKRTSDESAAGIAEVERSISEVMKTLDLVILDLSASRLQAEMATFFISELLRDLAGEGAKGSGLRVAARSKSIGRILGLLSGQTDQATRHIVEIGAGGFQLHGKLKEIQESVKAMGIIQVSGLVETARLEKASVFQTVFERVRHFSANADAEVGALAEMISSMADETRSISEICSSTRRSLGQINSGLVAIHESN